MKDFLDWPDISNWNKALPNVSREIVSSLGFHPKRVTIEGQHLVAIPVFDPVFVDVVAWCINAPDDIFRWSQRWGVALGRDEEWLARSQARQPVVFKTPLEWLQAGMRGVVYLG